VVFNRNCFSENERHSRVQPPPLEAVTYTVKLVVLKKWCKIDMMLLRTTNRKYHMAYQFVPFPVTLDDLEGHLHVAGLIKCNLTNICATFCTVSTDTACRVVRR